MQTNVLPLSIIQDIENCRKFLWNKFSQSHYIPRAAWFLVYNPTNPGGLGIRNLRLWNLAFMAKLGWKILNNPNKLWIRIFIDKYLQRDSFMNCHPSSTFSPIWRENLKGRSILSKGLMALIGNGHSVSLWFHRWVGESPLVDIIISPIPSTCWTGKSLILLGQSTGFKEYSLSPP